MNSQYQRTVAVWTVLVLTFVVTGFLARRESLTPLVVTLYWVPVVVLAMLGVLPAPWRVSTG